MSGAAAPAVSGRIVVFGDPWGIPLAIRAARPSSIVGLVAASRRPAQRDTLIRIAARLGVPLLVQPPRSELTALAAFESEVVALRPDLFLVVSYSMLVAQSLLSRAMRGGINLHCAPLPRYRGPNPIQWAVINGETRFGVTLHAMTSRFDDGAVIGQRLFAIRQDDTWVDVLRRCRRHSSRLLRIHLPALMEGTAIQVPQDESQATRSPRRTPEDGSIDWNKPVRDIFNLVRALVHPLPGAFADSGRRRIVFDRYMNLGDIAALKFGPIGRHKLRHDGLVMAPERRAARRVRGAGTAEIVVNVRRESSRLDPVVRLEFTRVDLAHRSADLRIRAAQCDSILHAEIIRWAVQFANDELGVIRIQLDEDRANPIPGPETGGVSNRAEWRTR